MHIRKIEIANGQTSFHLKSAEDKCVLWPLYGKPGNSVFVMFHEHCSLIQFSKIYGLCKQGQEAGGHCHLKQCVTPSQRPHPGGAGALAPHRCANLMHLRSEGTGCWLPRMQKAPPCTTHLIVSYFVSASPPTNLSSSHRPSKISAFKKKNAQESISQSSQMRRTML